MKSVGVVVDQTATPPKKKLKQAQLSFQTVTPKIKITDVKKKRKLSDTSLGDEQQAIKHVRRDTNPSVVALASVIDLCSNDSSGNVDVDVLNAPPDIISEVVNTESVDNVDITEDDSGDQIGEERISQNNLQDKHSEDSENKEEIITEIDILMSTKPATELNDSLLVPIPNSDDDDNLNQSVETESESESIKSSPNELCTPTNKSKGSVTSGCESTPKSITSTPNTKLTPKQLQRRVESLKKREEREQIKLANEQKRLEEKAKRHKQKQDERDQRRKERKEKEEQKKKEREEKEQQKRKEREDRERKKQAEIDQKNEEKRLKEEDKRKKEEQKEEERRKKELEKEEADLKIKKASANFVNFFVPKKSESKKSDEASSNNVIITSFMPFAVRNDMRMAPFNRETLSAEQKISLDVCLSAGCTGEKLYLEEIKAGKKARRTKRTWSPSDNKDECIVIDSDFDDCGSVVEIAPALHRMRLKLLQFSENRRPPYWGTWRKKSVEISSRKPLATDKLLFDYEVDSDEEWEEEEPGESLHGSDDEKEPEDEYDVDNDFMVPHGYLSDEERQGEDEEETSEGETPLTHKEKLQMLEKEFQQERTTKTVRIAARITGCIWVDAEYTQPLDKPGGIWRYLSLRKMLIGGPVVIPKQDDDNTATSPSSSQQISKSKRVKLIPEHCKPDLIRLIHGNINGKFFLLKEFKTHLHSKEPDLTISKRGFFDCLRDYAKWISCPEEGTMFNRHCWYVLPEIREKYAPDVILPNTWMYILKPKRKVTHTADSSISLTPSDKEHGKKIPGLNITKYTKILSDEERQKQFIPNLSTFGALAIPVDGVQTTPIPSKVLIKKKRIQLTTLSNTTTNKKSNVKKTKPLKESSGTTVWKRSSADIGIQKFTSAQPKENASNSSPSSKKRVALITLSGKCESKASSASVANITNSTEECEPEIKDSDHVTNFEKVDKLVDGAEEVNVVAGEMQVSID